MSAKKSIKNQVDFINTIKTRLKPSESLVHEMADLLGLSLDSTYRRIRGEKKLTYDEIYFLCERYNLSFDDINCINGKSNVFSPTSSTRNKTENIKSILYNINSELEQIRHKSDKLVISTCNEIPFFRLFKYPRLTAFIISEWVDDEFNECNLEETTKDILVLDNEIRELTVNIAKLYNTTPSIEIWKPYIVDFFVKSIENYGNIESRRIPICYELLEDLMNLLDDVKFSIGTPNMSNEFNSNFKFYFNEFNFNSNYIYFYSGAYKVVYLKTFETNFISSTSPDITTEAECCLQNLTNKSTQFKNIKQQRCSLFFKKQKDLILMHKNKLLNIGSNLLNCILLFSFIHRIHHLLENLV
ncbi:MAG: hypothetical protein HXX16_03035 [Bacteroidales bacterium]|nr:hypothetical protein [Bacteroidales bacterium]